MSWRSCGLQPYLHLASIMVPSPNDHRDVAVPTPPALRAAANPGARGGAEVLLLSQPRNVQLRFAIRPLGH